MCVLKIETIFSAVKISAFLLTVMDKSVANQMSNALSILKILNAVEVHVLKSEVFVLSQDHFQ